MPKNQNQNQKEKSLGDIGCRGMIEFTKHGTLLAAEYDDLRMRAYAQQKVVH